MLFESKTKTKKQNHPGGSKGCSFVTPDTTHCHLFLALSLCPFGGWSLLPFARPPALARRRLGVAAVGVVRRKKNNVQRKPRFFMFFLFFFIELASEAYRHPKQLLRRYFGVFLRESTFSEDVWMSKSRDILRSKKKLM